MKWTTSGYFSGLALIVGSLLYMVSQALTPGGAFTDPSIRDLNAQPFLTHVSSQTGILGLLLVVYGMFAFWRGSGRDGPGDGLARFGVLVIVFSCLGFALSKGANHMIVHALGGHEEFSTATEQFLKDSANVLRMVRLSITVVVGSTIVLGNAALALGLWLRLSPGAHRTIALIAAILSIASLVSQVGATHFHTDILYLVAGLLTIPVGLWYISLGVKVLQDAASPDS